MSQNLSPGQIVMYLAVAVGVLGYFGYRQFVPRGATAVQENRAPAATPRRASLRWKVGSVWRNPVAPSSGTFRVWSTPREKEEAITMAATSAKALGLTNWSALLMNDWGAAREGHGAEDMSIPAARHWYGTICATSSTPPHFSKVPALQGLAER